MIQEIAKLSPGRDNLVTMLSQPTDNLVDGGIGLSEAETASAPHLCQQYAVKQ